MVPTCISYPISKLASSSQPYIVVSSLQLCISINPSIFSEQQMCLYVRCSCAQSFVIVSFKKSLLESQNLVIFEQMEGYVSLAFVSISKLWGMDLTMPHKLHACWVNTKLTCRIPHLEFFCRLWTWSSNQPHEVKFPPMKEKGVQQQRRWLSIGWLVFLSWRKLQVIMVVNISPSPTRPCPKEVVWMVCVDCKEECGQHIGLQLSSPMGDACSHM